MKVLVTGAYGQLGKDIVDYLKKQRINCLGVGRQDFDLLDYERAKEVVMQYAPNVIIHCAAYSMVDKAEDDIETCRETNVNGTGNIIKLAQMLDASIVFISTDYVFSGKKEGIYETNDIPEPLSVYGWSKYEAEELLKEKMDKYFIIRTSWLYGTYGNNFVKTILKLAKEKKKIDVVNDQVGSPTYTVDIAQFIYQLILTDKYGIYHVTNQGYCTWAEFAKEIIKIVNGSCVVNTVTSEEYKRRAKRPKNSRLSDKSIIQNDLERLPIWQDALKRYLEDNEY